MFAVPSVYGPPWEPAPQLHGWGWSKWCLASRDEGACTHAPWMAAGDSRYHPPSQSGGIGRLGRLACLSPWSADVLGALRIRAETCRYVGGGRRRG